MPRCISCNITVVENGFVRFPCPVCGHEISRCVRCRKQNNTYKCTECGFEGP